MAPTPRRDISTRRRFRFTNGHLDGLRPEAKPFNESDADVPGLTIHVGVSGTRSWWFRYHWRGVRKTITLGTYPALAIVAARNMARDARSLIDNGIEPTSAALVRKRAAPANDGETPSGRHIIENVVAEFFTREIEPNRKRPADVKWQLNKHVLPEWRGRDVRTIKPKDVRELLYKIADRGTKVTANRVAATVTQLFLYAVERDYVESSPVQLLRRPGGREKPRQRALSDKELAAYLKDPTGATRYRRLSHVINALLLTAARRSELALAKWRDIDFSEKAWTIPKENTKNGVECIVPLSGAAVAEFVELKKLADAAGSRWVLPGADPSKHLEPKLLTRGVAKCQKRFKAIGFAEEFTLHDLRRTCRTGLARLKVPPHIAELCLNHTQKGIVGTYDVYAYLDEKREALEKWAAHVESLKKEKAPGRE